jgi:hypothetical protein
MLSVGDYMEQLKLSHTADGWEYTMSKTTWEMSLPVS